MMLAPDDPRHGTSNGYVNLGCRCDACRVAETAYLRERGIGTYRRDFCACGNTKVLSATRCRSCAIKSREPSHGTESRYSAPHSCRCQECREAASAAKRRRREDSRVPCATCGTLVDKINRRDPDKPYECRSCSHERIHSRRKVAA